MAQNDTIMYAHGSAYNHGCEAIVRSSVKLLALEKDKTILYSNKIEGDLAFHLDDIVTVRPIHETLVEPNSARGIAYRIRSHMHKDHAKYYFRYFGKQQYQYMYNFGNVALSIGGDNYCYSSAITGLVVRNYWLNRKGFKTILWGASLTEELMTLDILEDLNRYSLITVRDTMSFDLLKKNHVKAQITCSPDPAFALEAQETDWPDGKIHNNVIGINISPFVMELSASANSGLENYVNLIRWALKETDCEIALIPHVVFPQGNNNDIKIAEQLLENLPETDRLFMVDNPYNCCQLKSLISKCRFFVGSRTHSTIAAYSTYVPTIVVGYSNKSVGIARDLFGTEQDYVCSVQDMIDSQMLTEAFRKMYLQENLIRRKLKSYIPEYLKEHQKSVDAASALLKK